MNYYCIRLGSSYVDSFVSYINHIGGAITGCTYDGKKYMFVYKSHYKITRLNIIDYMENIHE